MEVPICSFQDILVSSPGGEGHLGSRFSFVEYVSVNNAVPERQVQRNLALECGTATLS